MTPRLPVICERCGDILGDSDKESHAICNKCLDILYPHHADIIREILEVDRIEEIFLER